MKTIFLLFDSLNRRSLPCYGGDAVAPNFSRLAARTAVFDQTYVCSMPCMPARRDMLTGRPNFLHRSWGPMEPYDDSLPRLLQAGGIYTHLISDHYHYWEEGGANYHTQYNTWEIVRGQEGDPWIPRVRPPETPDAVVNPQGYMAIQDAINRQVAPQADDQPISKTFRKAARFLEHNHAEDNWFLQIETFDPHEPFFSHQRYKDLYAEHFRNYRGKPFDWPPYREVRERPEEVEHARYEYAALVSMCDEKLGEVLDLMDRYDLWKDTQLIVATDHGFLLGEHGCWAKGWVPFYNEIAHTPFFVWDPRSEVRGARRSALVQPALDLAPTVLRFHGLEPTPRMTGKDLAATVAEDAPVREHALFGLFGCQVNITDGRHVYMRGNPGDAPNEPLYEYTLMPSGQRGAFAVERFQTAPAWTTFGFTQGCHLMQIPARVPRQTDPWRGRRHDTFLFDLAKDPTQEEPIRDERVERRLLEALDSGMRAVDSPPEQWQRLGMP